MIHCCEKLGQINVQEFSHMEPQLSLCGFMRVDLCLLIINPAIAMNSKDTRYSSHTVTQNNVQTCKCMSASFLFFTFSVYNLTWSHWYLCILFRFYVQLEFLKTTSNIVLHIESVQLSSELSTFEQRPRYPPILILFLHCPNQQFVNCKLISRPSL